MKRWDAIFIGSGISSLLGASLLSKSGLKVCVLERYRKPGGYLHSFNRFGRRFDTGSHYVGAMGPGQTFRRLLEYVDIYDPDHFVPMEADGFDVYRFPSFELKVPFGYQACVESFSREFPGDVEAIQKYFSEVERTARKFATYNLAPDLRDPGAAEAFETSLKSVVESITSNPKLQTVFYMNCTLHGVLPEDTSIGFHSIVTDSLVRGCYGFADGGDPVAEAFVEVIQNNGGEVLLGHEVSELCVKDFHVQELKTADGESFEADWYISGIHPKRLLDLVDTSAFRPAFRSRVQNVEESDGILGVYAVCNTEPPFESRRNYFISDSESPSEFLRLQAPDELPSIAYVSRADRIPSKTTKPGLCIHSRASYSWFDRWENTTFKKRPDAYHDFKTMLSEKSLSLVEKHFPGARDTIERYDASTPLTNIFYNGSVEGSAYGIYHSIKNSGVRQIGPRTKVRNLLLTGQSTLFPGMLGASLSGLRTVGHILGNKRVFNAINNYRKSECESGLQELGQ